MRETQSSPLPAVLEPAPPQYPPLEETVIVTMRDGTEFRAMRIWVEDDNGGSTAWATADEHEPLAPMCWCDGVCWATNSAGKRSKKPVAWRPIAKD